MSQDIHLNPKSILETAGTVLRRLKRYALPLFLLFVAVIYGYIVLQINSLNNTQPSADAVDSQVQAARVPHIDSQVIQQLQSLQDNSVSVQTLFDQARNNPFQ
jgi:hypothetical protein